MKILPLFITHQGCPFQCLYCNQKAITKSSGFNFEKAEQLLADFCKKNLETTKEVAFFGGTFTSLPLSLQKEYFALVQPYLPKLNGIRISTRPDFIDESILANLRQNKVTVIELGIQSFSDDVLTASKRGYNSQTSQTSCQLIKENGFKLGIQLMPGLPGFLPSTWEKTLEITANLQPSYVRLYPTVVLANTELENLYKNGAYKPLSLSEAITICAEASEKFSQNNIQIIKIGLHSDIDEVIAGPYHPALGEIVKGRILCQELIRNYKKNHTLFLNPRYISLLTGFNHKNAKFLKKTLHITKLPITLCSKTDYFSFKKKKAKQYL